MYWSVDKKTLATHHTKAQACGRNCISQACSVHKILPVSMTHLPDVRCKTGADFHTSDILVQSWGLFMRLHKFIHSFIHYTLSDP